MHSSFTIEIAKNVQKNNDIIENEDFDLLCNEFMPREGELENVDLTANIAKRGNFDETIDYVASGRGRSKRAKLEFVPANILPEHTAIHDEIDNELATLLPGEKLPVFKY